MRHWLRWLAWCAALWVRGGHTHSRYDDTIWMASYRVGDRTRIRTRIFLRPGWRFENKQDLVGSDFFDHKADP